MKLSHRNWLKQLAAPVTLTLALSMPGAAFGISSAFSQMADAMKDGFTPGSSSFDFQARGYAAGPRIRVRYQPWEIQELRFVTAKPPSWDVGCRGWDFHGGAISWLTKEDIKQVFAQFADPQMWIYIAYLALMQACPQCANVAGKLQQWANTLNQSMNINCEATANAIAMAASNKDPMALVSQSRMQLANMWPDFGGSQFDQSTNVTNSSELLQDAEGGIDTNNNRKLTGNYVWDALNDGLSIDNALASNAVGITDSTELKLLIMTITGVYISRYDGTGELETRSFLPHPPRLEQLIFGDKLEVYGCATGMPANAEKYPGTSGSSGYIQTVEMCRWLLQDTIPGVDEDVDRLQIEIPSLYDAAFEMINPENPDSLFYLMGIHSTSAELSEAAQAFSDNSGFPLIKIARDYALGGIQPPVQHLQAIAIIIATEQALAFVQNALDIAQVAVSLSYVDEFKTNLHRHIVNARSQYIMEAEHYYHHARQILEINHFLSEDALRNMLRRTQGRN